MSVHLQRSDWELREGHPSDPCRVCGEPTQGRTEGLLPDGRVVAVPICSKCFLGYEMPPAEREASTR